MKIALAALVLAAGCSNLRPADYADSASTALAIADGAVELNPIVGALGDDMAAPVALVLTAGARYAIDEYAEPENVDKYHDTLSTAKWAVTCNNLAVWAGAEPVIAIVSAIGCGTLSWWSMR